jgi:hypothetical protein
VKRPTIPFRKFAKVQNARRAAYLLKNRPSIPIEHPVTAADDIGIVRQAEFDGSLIQPVVRQ